MHNDKINIDELMREKAAEYKVDSSFMMQDFATIKNALPTATSATGTLPTPKNIWFSLNNIIWMVGAVGLLTGIFYFVSKNDNRKKNQLIADQNETIFKDSIPNVSTETDTPVVLTEFPKDPSKAPKKWIYKMQIPFTKGEKPTISQKKYIDLHDVTTDKKDQSIPSIDYLYQSLKKEAEFFKINPTIEQYVRTKKGNQYFIEANSFVQENGQPVTEELTLEVNENYYFIDFIANQLNTNYKSTYIETEGMIYLNAFSKKQTVSKIMSKPLQAIFKTNHFNASVQLFNLTEKGWLANGQFQNAEVNNNIKENHAKNSYVFNLYHLNWINIAKFNHTNNTHTIRIQINETQQEMTAYLMLNKNKICTGIVTNNEQLEFKNIPKGENALLFLIVPEGNQIKPYIYNINTNTQNTSIQLSKPLPIQQVKAKLEELGSVR